MKTFKTKNGTELPLLNLKGKDYLQVMHRLVWFREEHPNWSIQTELAHNDKEYCIAKATIMNEVKDGFKQIIATAHKREDARSFPDYMEKAETGAIGRALGMCGYGTQFAPEFDEGERIVDSPVGKPNPHAAGAEQPGPRDGIQHQGYVIPGHIEKYAGKILEMMSSKEITGLCDKIESKYPAYDKMPVITKECYDKACSEMAKRETPVNPDDFDYELKRGE